MCNKLYILTYPVYVSTGLWVYVLVLVRQARETIYLNLHTK